MNEKIVALLLVIATFAALYFLFANPAIPYQNAPAAASITNFEVSNQNPNVAEKIIVKVEAKGNSIDEITLEGVDAAPVKCNGSPECRANFQISFSAAGAYRIKAFAKGNFPAAESSKIIYVTDKIKTCIDGTTEGSCSAKKSFLCSEGRLIEQCKTCGCDDGKQCSDNKCIAESLPLEITGLGFPGPFSSPGKMPEIIIEMQNRNSGRIYSGASYEIKFVISKHGGSNANENIYLTKTFSLESDLEKNGVIGKIFSGEALLDESIYDLNASIQFPSEKINSFVSENALIVRNDSTAPSKPLLLSARKHSGNAVELSWLENTADDLSYYKIYRSIDESAAFLSYTYAGMAVRGNDSALIWNLEGKQHFFVIKAVDYFGNESEFSNVVLADLG